jgi:hypothetical protein
MPLHFYLSRLMITEVIGNSSWSSLMEIKNVCNSLTNCSCHFIYIMRKNICYFVLSGYLLIADTPDINTMACVNAHLLRHNRCTTSLTPTEERTLYYVQDIHS